MVAISKPTVGSDTDSWGSKINTALDTLASAVTTLETAASGGGGGTGSVPLSAVQAKGDLIVGTASAAVARLAAGTNGYTLTRDSNQSNGLYWALPPGSLMLKVRATSAQTLNTATFLPLAFGTEDYDRTGSFSPGSTTYTPGIAGWYELTGGCSFTGSSVGVRVCCWALNGSSVQATANSMMNMSTTIAESLSARTFAVFLGSTDSVSMLAYHNNGSTLNTFASGPYGAHMTVKWLGP